MTRTTSKRLRGILGWAVASAIVGVIYASGLHGAPPANGAVVGAIFGSLVAVFFTYVAPELRRFRFVTALALKVASLTVMMLVGLTAGIYLFGLSDNPAYFDARSLQIYWLEADWGVDVVFMIGTALLINVVLSLQELVGPTRFWQILAGAYHQPRHENRIFVFLDLADSTAIAERLNDLGFHALLQRLVRDISPVIDNHHGTIDRYIGDAIVITWPVRDHVRNADCLNCLTAIAAHLRRNDARYQKQFGLTPHYRAGCHAGPIVAGEIGERRKEILFLGDTVNTAARLEEAAKQQNRDILVSGDLLEQLTLPAHLESISLGRFNPRGRQQSLDLYAIEEKPTAQ